MSFTESLIIAAIPTIIGIIGTYFVTSKSHFKDLSDRLGLKKGQTLYKYLLNSFKSLDGIIGKGKNDKTLTGQNKDLQKLLNKEIDLIEQRYAEEEKRLIQFTYELRNISCALNDFKLFMESWTRTTAENDYLKIQISSLQQQLDILNNKRSELETQNQILKFQTHIKSDTQHSNDDLEL